MKYINVEKDIWVEVDEKSLRSVAFNKSAVEKEVVDLQTRLQAIPSSPTDKELLAWAKANYPQMNYEPEKQATVAKIAEINNKLNQIK